MRWPHHPIVVISRTLVVFLKAGSNPGLKNCARASAFGQRIVGVLESKRLCKICSLGFEALLIGGLLGVTGHGWLRSWRRCTEKGFVGEEKSAKRDYMKEPSSEILGSCIIELLEW